MITKRIEDEAVESLFISLQLIVIANAAPDMSISKVFIYYVRLELHTIVVIQQQDDSIKFSVTGAGFASQSSTIETRFLQ